MSLKDLFKKKKRHVFTDEERELSGLTRQLKQQHKIMQQRVAIQETKNLLNDLKEDFSDDEEAPMGGFEGMLQNLLMQIMQKMNTAPAVTSKIEAPLQNVTTTSPVLSTQQIELIVDTLIKKISKKDRSSLRESLVAIPQSDVIRIINCMKAKI